MKLAKYLYRRNIHGKTVRVCASTDDLPGTARECGVSTTIQGLKGRVWVRLFRCEGLQYAVPYNGLEARNL